ncbi:CRISPR-associated helicase Cas3' [Nostoc sp. FACHB-280]|uniref:CRISPR-associated helicase Cas3' n=1 Tax=Nostoc sp. FACHB-280 TaxID=2692839 RepID=UPI00168B8865|nr:CRISPR-associated helicase Cas3' [Nostoc sp. FACHB-280]MBD2492940.1 CRISPR-associated helicase Cas3' [Nostoc sp. FACHB-280]
MQKQLLAKSPREDGKILTVEEHLSDTDNAVMAIFKQRILLNWCRFFGVKDADKFILNLRIAALFHDIGKANAEFDAAVNKKLKQQTLRHEWLSALILHLPSVRSWLASNKSDLDLEVITAAVLSHHLKASKKEWGKPRTVEQVELFLHHPEITNILQKIAEIAKIEGLPAELPDKWLVNDPLWQQAYFDADEAGAKFSDDIYDDIERRSLLLAVKAGLIAADSVASAMFREKKLLEQWVDETLHAPVITAEELETKILQPRYAHIEKKSDEKFELHPFQKKAQEQGDRVLLLSGCGSGKTIFGYKWHQAALSRNQVGHIIFLYPTRGTATEGFKDYVSCAPETDASLVTGTAIYELQEMAKNPSDYTPSEGKDFTTDERLFALGFWGKRFFSATVDQFLCFLTHGYSGLCLLPVLADSVIVIDEVHSFSRGMFDNLISFLQNFNIPVLCMTATLTKTRQEELKNAGLKVFPAATDEKLKEIEEHPRYDVKFVAKDSAYSYAKSAYQDNQFRVLWVVNTVDRCRKIAGRREDNTGLEFDLDTEVLTYHSRFKLKDRQKRHQETIAAFAYEKGERKPAIAVTTQVCEMSLDLDADVLITELAPISSLVQRFGRSNRHLSHGNEFRSQILVYEPDNIKPYQKDEIKAAKKFIEYIQGEKISQAQLAKALEDYSPAERYADGNCAFLEGGYWAKSQPFRDTDDYSVDAILSSDLKTVGELLEQKNPYDGYVLPVPKKLAHQQWKGRPEKMPRYLAVADASLYCPRRGFGEWKI